MRRCRLPTPAFLPIKFFVRFALPWAFLLFAHNLPIRFLRLPTHNVENGALGAVSSSCVPNLNRFSAAEIFSMDSRLTRG
jgi:hypothetical protein